MRAQRAAQLRVQRRIPVALGRAPLLYIEHFGPGERLAAVARLAYRAAGQRGSALRPPISIDVKVSGDSIVADSIER